MGVLMMKRSIGMMIVFLLLLSVVIVMVDVDPIVGSRLERSMNLKNSDASFIGEDTDDNSGYSVAIIGDVNGDGYEDILIGARYAEILGSATGVTYLILGGPDGWKMDEDLSNADASFEGEFDMDYSGMDVSGAGDVNGDGYADFLIGAPFNDQGGNTAGKTYLVMGRPIGFGLGMSLADAEASFIGEGESDQSGHSISGVGDVNGDGYDDILIGASLNDTSNYDEGKVYLILGKESGWSKNTSLSSADASFTGESTGDRAGHSVSGAGDVNGDGLDDILIGARANDDGGAESGQTYLILGKRTGWSTGTSLSAADSSFLGEDTGDNSGDCVSNAGDVNGDGYDDILIGARNDEDGGSSSGQTYLIFGQSAIWGMDTSLSTADASYWGEEAYDYSGLSLSGAGDVNDDGYDDFLIGAYNNDVGGTNAGKTYLILGEATGWSMDTDLSEVDASFFGEDPYDYCGYSVSGGGDVNDDGFDDILIGASGDEEGGSNSGQTYLILCNRGIPKLQYIEAALMDHGSKIQVKYGRMESWNEPVTGYRLYRSSDGINYHLIDTTGRSHVDEDVVHGTVYHYAARAVDASGDISPMSDSVSIMCEVDTNDNGIGDSMDVDDEGDGILDINDPYPLVKDPELWTKTGISVTRSSASFLGENADDNAGFSVHGGGDVNGDGYGDFLIGAWYNDDGGADAGKTYLFLGRPEGWAMDTDIGDADASFIGEDSADYSSRSVAIAGDLNGDGYDDIVIGANGDDVGGSYAGKAYIIFGKASGWKSDQDLSTSDASYIGESSNDNAGSAVAGAGDVNGDGYDDLLIGAHRNSEIGYDSGKAYLVLGRSNGWVNNHDLSKADASFLGESAQDYAGRTLAGGGDVNGDGLDDFLIGAPWNDEGTTNAGQTYLILGRTSGWSMDMDLADSDASFLGSESNEYFGSSFSCSGDINGDGYDDIVMASSRNEGGGTSLGRTFIFFGKDSGWMNDTDQGNSDASIVGDDRIQLGVGVSTDGDLNNDGYDDILVATGNYRVGGVEYGKIYAIHGGPDGWRNFMSSSIAETTYIGEEAWDTLAKPTYVGDTNGDGIDDFLMAAQRNDEAGTDAGQVYLINRSIMPEVEDVEVEVLPDGTGTNISWTGSISDPFEYGVYKGHDKGSMVRVTTTTKTYHNDHDVIEGSTYIYAVSIVDPLGGESALGFSNPLVMYSPSGDLVSEIWDMLNYINNTGDPTIQDIGEMISYINGTLDTKLDIIRSYVGMNRGDLVYMNTSIGAITSNITDLGSGISGIDMDLSSLLLEIREHRAEFRNHEANYTTDLIILSGVLASLGADLDSIQLLIEGIDSDLAALDSGMDGHFLAVMALLSRMDTNVTDLDSSLSDLDSRISSTLNGIISDMEVYNDTMAARIDLMELDLEAAMTSLAMQLETMNTTLQYELQMLGAEVGSLRDLVSTELMAVIEDNLTGEIIEIKDILDNLNGMSLPELSTKLELLEVRIGDEDQAIRKNISLLREHVNDFDTRISLRIDNIATILEILEDLGVIRYDLEEVSSDLETLQILEATLSDIESEQTDTSSKVGSSSILLWVVLVLMIVILVLLVLLFLRSRKEVILTEIMDGPQLDGPTREEGSDKDKDRSTIPDQG